MSASALHLNLLNPQEQKPASQVRVKVILPIAAGLVTAFVLLWGGFVGSQLLLVNHEIGSIQREIGEFAPQKAENEALTEKVRDLQAEADQFSFYRNGRTARGELLKRLAYAIPSRITLTSLSLPPQPDQGLTPPPGSRFPPLQGPTQTVEQVELRLIGLAQEEQDVFNLMNALKGNAFTGLVSIVERPRVGELESPRVLAFRQETKAASDGRRGVFFDIVYDLQPRVFVR